MKSSRPSWHYSYWDDGTCLDWQFWFDSFLCCAIFGSLLLVYVICFIFDIFLIIVSFQYSFSFTIPGKRGEVPTRSAVWWRPWKSRRQELYYLNLLEMEENKEKIHTDWNGREFEALFILALSCCILSQIQNMTPGRQGQRACCGRELGILLRAFFIFLGIAQESNLETPSICSKWMWFACWPFPAEFWAYPKPQAI